MKKILFVALVIFMVIGISSVAFSSENFETVYEFNPVSKFRATGIVMDNTENPYTRLQNLMDFELKHNEYVNRSYSVVEPEGTDFFPGTYTLEFNIRYSSVLLQHLDKFFIDGTFIYTLDQGKDILTTKGYVKGYLTNATMSGRHLPGLSDDTFFILLDCRGTEDTFRHIVYLSTPNIQLITTKYVPITQDTTDTNNTSDSDSDTSDSDSTVYEDYFSHESKPHIPGPRSTVDLAGGVGIASIGIFFINTLTNTSVFGSASFSGDLSQTVSPNLHPETGASGGMTSAAAGQSTATAGSNNIFSVLRKFVKNLFEVLRDMLTDEGRSFASGKITDILSETDLTDMSDNE